MVFSWGVFLLSRLARGLPILAVIMLPLMLLLATGHGLALFMILAYMLPGLILHHLAPAIPLEATVPASIIIETVLLSWWIGGARSRGGLAIRGIMVAIVYYAAVFIVLIMFVIESVMAGL